jgi:putative solute:sodium symporter small subunit
MAAQGSLLIFLLIVVVYVWIMERLDREHGFEEDLS